MRKNFWLALLAFAVIGISFAGPMMMPGGGMGAGPGQETGSGGDADSSYASSSFVGGASPGLPLTEVGIGLAILAAGYWWFEVRKSRKRKPPEGEEDSPDEREE
ncbi:hypothetical protein JW721_04565 [Candidatus Micrarchaeota archaeon]|nr:hypothetical protein [Candidatus Micrarchaeota archaeon]